MMARTHTIGPVLGSGAHAVEWYNNNYTGQSPGFSSSVQRNGHGSFEVGSLTSGVLKGIMNRATPPGTGIAGFANGVSAFLRAYTYIVTLPSAANAFFGWSVLDTNISTSTRVRLNSDGTMSLVINASTTLVVVGTTLISLSPNTWYRLELMHLRHATTPNAGADTATFRVFDANDTLLATITSSTLSIEQIARCAWCGANGEQEAQTTGLWYFSDIATNDSSGTDQNTWPGPGKVVALHVNGAGEFAQTITGTTPLWEQLDEVPPDDATTSITLTTNTTNWNGTGSRAMFALGSIPEAPASIAVVHLGIRVWNNSASGSNFSVGAQIANGGTIDETAGVVFANGVGGPWVTNHSSNVDRNYRHTRYTDPGGSGWTEATLNSLQVGLRATDASPTFNVTKLWAVVDYVPQAVSGAKPWHHYARMRQ